MTKSINRKSIILALMTISLVPMTPLARSRQTAPNPQNNENLLTEGQVKELLLLMDNDKNGKISKQEWMNFMSAEFDRLDRDNSGDLDPVELMQSRLEASSLAVSESEVGGEVVP